MKINGQPVSRSEFEYSYNKNNSEGVIDKKSVEEYVDLFVNYKLKVEAAKDAHLDTLKTFKDEFTSYRDQQIRPAFITDADVEKEAQKIYKETQTRIDSMGGMVKASHILLLLGQKATQEQQDAAKVRIDSIYNELKKGADFAELAKKLSDDKQSARNGGELPWLTKGQTLPAFEKALFQLNKGEMSEPVLTEAGYHIIKVIDKGSFFPYDSVHADILQFIEQRQLREHIIDQKIDEIAKAEEVTKEQLLDAKTDEMVAKDMDLKYLIQEYHDGLLLYEISNATVWDKAAKDEAGLANYFKKNKKKYKWDAPRFKGIAYHVKDAADVKAVKNAVKNISFDKWADVLRKTFNNDSILRIRVEKGISYLEFGWLTAHAHGIITDSGNVAEEATFNGVPCITLNSYTEHIETVKVGTNVLVGEDAELLGESVRKMVRGEWKQGNLPDRWDGRSAERIVQILMEYAETNA